MVVQLNDDGTIDLTFDTDAGEERTVRLRRPRLGQFKRLRSYLNDVNAEHRAFVATLREPPAEGEAAPDAQAILISVAEALEEASLKWWRLTLVGDDTFVALATETVPDESDWPVWLQTPDSITKTFAHWRSVPLRSGAPQ